MSEILAAILGGLLGGGLQILVGGYERRRQGKSVLNAIICEVNALCNLIRFQKYLDLIEIQISAADSENWQPSTIVIEIRSNYFSIYESLAHNLGLIEPHQVSKIVQFYSCCKSAIDCTRPDGIQVNNQDRNVAVFALKQIQSLLDSALRLGDEIVQFQKSSIEHS
jgi:hypothetical protein